MERRTNRDMLRDMLEENVGFIDVMETCDGVAGSNSFKVLKADEMQYAILQDVEELICYCYKAMKEGDAWLDQTIV